MVFLVSVVPFIELRGAIPLAVAFGHSLEFSLVLCIILNILVVPIAFFLLDFIIPPLRKRVKVVERLFRWSVKRAEKHQNLSLVGLTLFVGIPLPFTGAYTGSLIAYLFGWDRKWAAVAIAIGVIMAGALIAFLTAIGIDILGLTR